MWDWVLAVWGWSYRVPGLLEVTRRASPPRSVPWGHCAPDRGTRGGRGADEGRSCASPMERPLNFHGGIVEDDRDVDVLLR